MSRITSRSGFGPLFGILITSVALAIVGAQTPGASSSVIRLDPALDAIISSSATLDIVSRDPAGTEGPVWIKDGQYLLFTSSDNKGRIYKLTGGSTLSPFLEPSGGATGLAFDQQGRLILAEFADKALVRIEKAGSRTTLADQFEGRPLNGPNDVSVGRDDSIYFTDELSVFRWKNGMLQELIRSVVTGGNVVNGRPGGRVVNGITVSPDGKFLYLVVVPQKGSRKIARYELKPDGTFDGQRGRDGTITDERIWFPLPDQDPPPTRQSGQPDGIKVDLKGNVYFGGPGGLWIVSPDATHLGTILVPGGQSNLSFGDADGKTLYIMLGAGVARIRLVSQAL